MEESTAVLTPENEKDTGAQAAQPVQAGQNPETGQVASDEDIIIEAHDLGLKTRLGTPYEHINLRIPRGQVIALCGENGSGKSALLLTLAGRMVSNKGTLTIDGYRLPRQRHKMRREAGLGFFDAVNEVQPSLTVRTLTAAELELYGKKSGKKRTMEYLRTWGLEDIAMTRAENLTSEERLRFGIALGMVPDPRILVLDDIEADLTQHQGRKMMAYLKVLAQNGLTVLVGCTEYEIARGADGIVLLSRDAYAQRDKVEQNLEETRSKMVNGTDTIPPAPAIRGGVA